MSTSKAQLRSRQPKLPRPVSARSDEREGVSLKRISMLDHRYAVVKQMQRQIKQLLDDTGGATFEAKALAGRAVFLLAYCEAKEVEAIEGKEISYSEYCKVTRSLIDVLHKLGMKREARSAIRLQDYLADAQKSKPKNRKKKRGAR
jgi:hypothetical protein